jgi:hypothetical protein
MYLYMHECVRDRSDVRCRDSFCVRVILGRLPLRAGGETI